MRTDVDSANVEICLDLHRYGRECNFWQIMLFFFFGMGFRAEIDRNNTRYAISQKNK